MAIDLFKSLRHSGVVSEPTVRTSLDIPKALHRRLHAAAARRGCSARQLILVSIEKAVEAAEPERPRRRLALDPPILASRGVRIDLSNAQLYDLIEFP